MRPGPNTPRLTSFQAFAKPRPTLHGLRRGLGQAVPAPDKSTYNLAGQYLLQANTRIKALEQSLIAAQQNSNTAYIQTMSPSITAARQRYETLLSAYIYAYGAAFGPPSTAGLTLGQWQVYVVVGIGIAAVVAGAIELNKYLDSVEQQATAQSAQAAAMQTQQSNITYAQQQLAAAQAAGDAAAAAQWQAVLQANAAYQPGAGGASSGWLSSNWPWVVAGGAALFILSRAI